MGVRDSLRVPDSLRGNSARALALIPLVIGIVFAALLLPRRAVPDLVPLPVVDHRAFAAQVAADHTLAETARSEGLADDVRLLGTALREFHTLEAKDSAALDIHQAKVRIDTTLKAALEAGGVDSLLRLRAIQLEGFLEETRKFVRSGEESDEFVALSGSFVRSLRREGWCKDHTIALSEDELRVLYKRMWSSLLGLEVEPALKPTTDELRVLYTFYLTHPHPKDKEREAIASARRAAKDQKACDALAAGERLYAETWRLEKINQLAQIDPDYPVEYARGVANFRRGYYGASADAFRDWLRAHPSGAWSLRAQNHLKAAIEAEKDVP